MWSRMIEAMVLVEETAPESGLLAFGIDSSSGGILVERGRICWAAAPGMQQRLRDLLQASSTDRVIDFETIYQRCRASGLLLGQTLVDEGLVTPGELEHALRRHSAESLIALCSEFDEPATWMSRGDRGYAPRFTFRPLDVLLDVAAISVPEVSAAAHAELAPFDAAGRRGVAFLLDGIADAPVPVGAFGELTVHELARFGAWAAALPDATRELGASPSFALAATAEGDVVAAWWRGAVLCVVACADRLGMSQIISHFTAGGDR